VRAVLIMAVAGACSSPHDEPRRDPPVRGSNATPTIAIALVFNGQEVWVGNDDYERDDNARYQGWLYPVEKVIDDLPLAKAGPPGSQAVVVAYADNAKITRPMGPLERLTGAALGTEQDYRGNSGADVAAGMSLGLAELARVSTDRKLLITIGGEYDSRSLPALATLAAQAKQHGVERFALLLRGTVEAPEDPVDTPLGRTVATASSLGIAVALRDELGRH
jgi:hypothetical protein